LPLSIVTDFEEFAIYDCRQKPDKNDKASKSRLLYFTFRDYAEKWDDISAIFSKDAVLKGSFDRYAVTTKGKRGTTEVDSAFLEEIENWRNHLAHNIALRNANLTQRELNFAVQQTIDRIIFLRICEDRGIEPYGRLQSLASGTDIYTRLTKLFREADDRYNSGLFHFTQEKQRAGAPDELTLHLNIDDKPLKEIFKNLYYPDCPYVFSVFGADILGSVYEQFLGKVIRLTAGNRAVVEDKPEVKKAGGVFYTPAYIVQYIVQHTVGKLLEGKTSKQAEGIRILDPACGSGSFLIGAYQHLLDWYLAHYVEEGAEKNSKGKAALIRPSSSGEWRLTTAEKKRILLEHIYGVDIDTQAVEVTKLSLLLKVLEGESGETLTSQMKLFHERVLPDLDRNIQCGNSLIGPDFYDGQLDLDDEGAQRINVFDWQAAFPQVFKAGGFDAVIGNPPYIRIQRLNESSPQEIDFYKQSYTTAAKGNYDIYVIFIERGLQLLNRIGKLGFILPNKFFTTDYGGALRDLLWKGRHIESIVDFGHEQVFEATTYTCLLFLSRAKQTELQFARATPNKEDLQTAPFLVIDQNKLGSESWSFSDANTSALIKKLHSNGVRLLDLPASMSRGSSTGHDEAYLVSYEEARQLEQGILRTPLFATDFGRYEFRPSGKWRIIFPYAKENENYHLVSESALGSTFPKTYTHLKSYKSKLEERKQFKEWTAFSAPRNLLLHDRAQIAIPLLANKGMFALIPTELQGSLCPMASGGFTITIHDRCAMKPEYVLGLLNSHLLFWLLRLKSNVFRGGWITCTKQYVGELPIHRINLTDHAEKEEHEKLVALVEKMLALHQQLAAAKTPQDTTLLQRQIAATDNQIDQLVYALYGLTDEEIALVEKI
jgi:type I restriction-modification system DNA methylase subunit